MKHLALLFSLLSVLLASCSNSNGGLTFERLDDYQTPDTCFNKGVSAAFCGISGNHLIVAGGCNFPHTPASQGGEKVFYDYIWATPLEQGTDTAWKLVGRLPVASAYGIAVPYQDGMVCIGGLGAGGQKLKNAYKLQLVNNTVTTDPLPELPVAIDNAAACLHESTVFIVGGNVDGTPSAAVYSLCLSDADPQWKVETTLPGQARVQPVCALAHGELYVWGGYAPKTDDALASMPENGWKYNLKDKSWTEVEAPRNAQGEIIALAGGAALASADGTRILCIGGVNQEIFPRALNGELSGPSYMEQPVEWYKFNRSLLGYELAEQSWEVLEEREEGARAGACLVTDGTWYYIVNGELKPGIRTPAINRFRME